MFIDEHKALREFECFIYCMQQSVHEFKKNNFIESSVYLENAARSLKALEELKEDEVDITITFIIDGGNVAD